MINSDIRFFIGPMSKNVVDAIIAVNNEGNFKVGFIPSRRQVEHDGGYVNHWTTKDFSSYVREINDLIVLQRDHGGPGQGYVDDNGFDSLAEDTKYMDLIHIDPWKKYPDYKDGLDKTIECINFCCQKNPGCYFEIGTEEAIRKFTSEELGKLITDLQSSLSEDVYSQITYAVVQSGTGLDLGVQKNTGVFDVGKLRRMVSVCKKHDLLSKEHNSDYLSIEEVRIRFDLGLSAINIGPELGQLETSIYLDILRNLPKSIFDEFYNICYESKRWEKWVNFDFDPVKEKGKVIKIGGHYVFSEPAFVELKNKILGELGDKESELDDRIKAKIKAYVLVLEQLAN